MTYEAFVARDFNTGIKPNNNSDLSFVSGILPLLVKEL